MRIKELTLQAGGAADDDAFALEQVLATYLEEQDGIAEDQVLGVAEDTDGLATAQSMTEEQSLSLEAAAADLWPPRKVTLTSSADLSAVTFVIEGLDEHGEEVSEGIAGPNNETVTSENFYSAVTAITPDTTDAESTVEAGWPNSDTPFPLRLEAGAASLDPPRPLTFTSASDLSGISFEIVGTDADGNPQTVEAFTGPNAETVQTTQSWSSVTSITPNDVSTSSLEVGWPDSTGARALTLKAAAAAISPPREVTLTSAMDLSEIRFTITGRDRYGKEISETIAGPNAGAVRTSKVFSAVTSIVPDGVTDAPDTDTVKAGYPARVCSPWIIAGGTRGDEEVPTATVQAIQVPGEAFATCIVERTFENFMRVSGEGAAPAATPDTLDQAGKVANVQAFGLRIVLTGETGAVKVAIARPGL